MSDVQKLNRKIDSVLRAEKITKARLGELSRELVTLFTIEGHNDIGMLNRLLAGLSPVNKKVSALYFPEFIPFVFDEKIGQFGVMIKRKDTKAKVLKAATEWLSVEGNTIWVWADQNVDIKAKPKDYSKLITALVLKALADEGDDGISSEDIVAAIIAGGVDDQALAGPLMNDVQQAA